MSKLDTLEPGAFLRTMAKARGRINFENAILIEACADRLDFLEMNITDIYLRSKEVINIIEQGKGLRTIPLPDSKDYANEMILVAQNYLMNEEEDKDGN